MKKIFLPFFTILLIYSCGNEGSESEKTTTKKDTLTEDTVTIIEDTIIEEPVIKERKRLPRMDGAWIADNLNDPFFMSDKVDSLVARYIDPENIEEMYPDYEVDYISEKEMNSLTPGELIYYCLAYPSSFSQICEEPGFPDETETPKLNAYLPFDGSGADWSGKQVEALKKRRKEVIDLLDSYIQNYPENIHYQILSMLVMLDGYKTIPNLLKTGKHNANNYTAILNMIGKSDDSEMLESLSFYEKLYGEESYTYQQREEATPARIKEVEKIAMKFYNTYKGK